VYVHFKIWSTTKEAVQYVQSKKNTSTQYLNTNGLSLRSIAKNSNESFNESEGESG
jgi:hypothetical protein